MWKGSIKACNIAEGSGCLSTDFHTLAHGNENPGTFTSYLLHGQTQLILLLCVTAQNKYDGLIVVEYTHDFPKFPPLSFFSVRSLLSS